ncbi:hypothetical protein RUM43_007286 [Polyplax serrata]|uniref:NADH:ubiquinone oxidoreductase intermediate-associated protein 30 domain-containing protein n=1 Tax=Polyplax serrata TaxID=468196 RepID=A0AAN8SA56_POLSC
MLGFGARLLFDRTALIRNKAIYSNAICIVKQQYRFFRVTPRLIKRFTHPTKANMTKSPEISELIEFAKNEPDIIRKIFLKLTQEFSKFVDEKYENSVFNKKVTITDYHDEVIDIVFKFDEDKDLDPFIVTTDSEQNINGFSSASLKITENKTALFSGNLSCEVPDSSIQYSGFVNLSCVRKTKSFNRPSYYDWRNYTHLVLKLRGDGRTWTILLSTPKHYRESWADQYAHPLYTRGGPYWQITKIPFSHFFLCTNTVVSKFKSSTIQLNYIARIGFTLSDNIDGPFKLELDYVGLENIPNHDRTSPYELYATDKYKAYV